ncbi:hypothetical protein [Escherichia coli]|nr:hypothetical protein [Escherichia coli]
MSIIILATISTTQENKCRLSHETS